MNQQTITCLVLQFNISTNGSNYILQVLSRKDKRLDYLVDPVVELLVAIGILAYCVQETWIVGNIYTVARDHMVFRHNK